MLDSPTLVDQNMVSRLSTDQKDLFSRIHLDVSGASKTQNKEYRNKWISDFLYGTAENCSIYVWQLNCLLA